MLTRLYLPSITWPHTLFALILCCGSPASTSVASTAATETDAKASSSVPAQLKFSHNLNHGTEAGPLLKGLSQSDLTMVQNSAKKYFKNRWKTINHRSRFVRFRMLESLDKLGAPASLQIIPVVESTYNPYALSHAGALGLWQLMPRTAKGLGIESDSKLNGRRNIGQSTEAAVQYLMQLHDRFDNWPLAIAAYNLGPNGVSRRLKKSPWDLADGLEKMPIPTSTRAYVQHVLGLVSLVNSGIFTFPEPVKTRALELQPPVDIHQLAKLSGMDKHDIFRFNPCLNQAQYFTRAVTIHVPESNYHNVHNNIAHAGPRFVQTKVRKGDSLWSIAKAHGLSVHRIKSMNAHTGNMLRIGQRLKIPANQLAKAHPNENPLLLSKQRIRYKVRSGDSLWAIASRFGTTAKAIARVNRMPLNSLIRTGDTLWVLAQVRPS